MVNMIKVKHKSNLSALKKSIELLGKSRVYVGIPAENASRDNGNDINNAELLYIQTHGVRKKSMREEMQLALNEGKAYSKAYEMYIKSHGSPYDLTHEHLAFIKNKLVLFFYIPKF